MPWSTVNSENSIHCILHYPRIDCLHLPGSLSFLGRPCCIQFSIFPQLRVNQWIESPLLSRLPPELPPPDRPPPNTPPISLHQGLQVHLQTRSITASKCISKLARLWPTISLEHVLYVRTIMALKCIYKVTWLQPPSSHNHGLQVHLQTRLITACKCVSKLAQSQPPSTSLMSDGRCKEIQG